MTDFVSPSISVLHSICFNFVIIILFLINITVQRETRKARNLWRAAHLLKMFVYDIMDETISNWVLRSCVCPNKQHMVTINKQYWTQKRNCKLSLTLTDEKVRFIVAIFITRKEEQKEKGICLYHVLLLLILPLLHFCSFCLFYFFYPV